MLIGYVRVLKSDKKNVLEDQLEALKEYGVGEDCIYMDRTDRVRDGRPELKACLAAVKKGDVLAIYTLNRIGRSLKNFVHIANGLIKRGVGLKILSEKCGDIDLTFPEVKNIFTALSELDRSFFCAKVKQGISLAKSTGKKFGRPRKMDARKIRFAMRALSNQNIDAKDIARKLGVTTCCMYLYVNVDGSLKEKGRKILDEKNLA